MFCFVLDIHFLVLTECNAFCCSFSQDDGELDSTLEVSKHEEEAGASHSAGQTSSSDESGSSDEEEDEVARVLREKGELKVKLNDLQDKFNAQRDLLEAANKIKITCKKELQLVTKERDDLKVQIQQLNERNDALQVLCIRASKSRF